MSKSFNRIWIHAIWVTKNREPLITHKLEKSMHPFLKEQFNGLSSQVLIINGMADHVHSLFSLSRQKSIADVMKQIKGASSRFVNKNSLISGRFEWQPGYAAFSVSDSETKKVFNYILNQKIYHQKKGLFEELRTMKKIS